MTSLLFLPARAIYLEEYVILGVKKVTHTQKNTPHMVSSLWLPSSPSSLASLSSSPSHRKQITSHWWEIDLPLRALAIDNIWRRNERRLSAFPVDDMFCYSGVGALGFYVYVICATRCIKQFGILEIRFFCVLLFYIFNQCPDISSICMYSSKYWKLQCNMISDMPCCISFGFTFYSIADEYYLREYERQRIHTFWSTW